MGYKHEHSTIGALARNGSEIVQTINLAAAAGLPEPEQKRYGTVTPHFKNKWRNRPCPCGSGHKTKVCCGPRLSR